MLYYNFREGRWEAESSHGHPESLELWLLDGLLDRPLLDLTWSLLSLFFKQHFYHG